METVKNTIAENFGGVAQKLAPSDSTFDIEKDVPDQTGKVALVTGGSEGIGYAASFTLLKNNLSKLFILSKSQEVFDGCHKDITEKLGADKAQRVTWLEADLADLKSTVQAAKKVSSFTDRLDILILNAGRGIMTYQQTEDSKIDLHMMANHVGHVVLASHLLPLLKKSAESNIVRIVLQASRNHADASKDTKFASIDELNQDLGPNQQYSRAKLANVLYARYLDRHLHPAYPNIMINATHPGFVESRMSTEHIHEPFPIAGYVMSVGIKPLKKNQWEGSASALFAATKTDKSGQYICPPAIVEPGSELSQSAALGEQLMELTRTIIKTKYGGESVDKGCPVKDY